MYGPLRDNLGMGRIRVAYTAGEAIGPELFEFYRSLGVNVKQLYGMTESSALICIQQDGDVQAGHGRPAAARRRGADQRERRGALSEPGRVPRLLPEPGGDARDARERLGALGGRRASSTGTATSRSSTAPATSAGSRTGTLFAPKYLENKLKFSPYVKEAVLRRAAGAPSCGALINIDLASVGNWAERRGLAYTSYTDLAQKPEVYELIRQEVVRGEPEPRWTRRRCAGRQIRRFLLLHKELDADDQEITRTRKVRRGFIAEKYAPLIEALYSGAATTSRWRRRSPTRTGAPRPCGRTCGSARRRCSPTAGRRPRACRHGMTGSPGAVAGAPIRRVLEVIREQRCASGVDGVSVRFGG